MSDLIYKEEAYRIIGICMEIHKALGLGLKEVNYKDAMEMEFKETAFPMKEKRNLWLRTKKRF